MQFRHFLIELFRQAPDITKDGWPVASAIILSTEPRSDLKKIDENVPSEDIEHRSECKKVQNRHFVIELSGKG